MSIQVEEVVSWDRNEDGEHVATEWLGPGRSRGVYLIVKHRPGEQQLLPGDATWRIVCTKPPKRKEFGTSDRPWDEIACGSEATIIEAKRAAVAALRARQQIIADLEPVTKLSPPEDGDPMYEDPLFREILGCISRWNISHDGGATFTTGGGGHARALVEAVAASASRAPAYSSYLRGYVLGLAGTRLAQRPDAGNYLSYRDHEVAFVVGYDDGMRQAQGRDRGNANGIPREKKLIGPRPVRELDECVAFLVGAEESETEIKVVPSSSPR